MSTQAVQRTEWSRHLAQALVNGGYANEQVLAPLLAEAVEHDVALGSLLSGRGLLPAAVVVHTLAQLARLPVLDLQTEEPAPEAVQLLPPALSAGHGAVAVRVIDDRLVVAFGEPPAPAAVRSLSDLAGREVLPVLADPAAIERLVRQRGADVTAAGQPPPAGAEAGAGGAPGVPFAPGVTPANGNGHPGAGGGPGFGLHANDLLRYAVGVGASDIHLTADMPPTVRLHGALRPIEGVGPLDHVTLREMIFGILPQIQRERFEAEHELDTSHTIADVGRFRVNLALQRGSIAVAMRPIPHEIPEFETLGLPESVRSFTDLRRGLVLVTGPTGSGKSTSLASLIDIINRTKPLHIVTIEDPIEFVHEHKRSIISQREVGADTDSFAEALRRVLRQDPDVILVGELRDLETISTALTAAETGHLVFATLHTLDAPSTIDRIIDVFPPNQQEQIRIQLGAALQGVVTQQLVPRADGSGRSVAAEVLVCTPAIQNLIRAAKTHQIYSLMQTGGQYGMQTMDQSLALLVRQGAITEGVAVDRARSEEDFRNHLHNR
ncbi:MAG TPA: PilT/PilU family type 4a pilus ATPase [Acidimicrobiales bacterium]|nr:PilT/PilU family type 4a pilus ATPase [Acidimicrobiales bacterium]